MYKPSRGITRNVPCFHLDGIVSCRKSSIQPNTELLNYKLIFIRKQQDNMEDKRPSGQI